MSESVIDTLNRLARMGRHGPRPAIARRRRRAQKLNKPKYKGWRWEAEYTPCNAMTQTNNEMFVGFSDASDLTKTKIVNARTEAGLPTFVDTFSVLATREQWSKFLRAFYDDHQVVQYTDRSGIMIGDNDRGPYYITYDIHSSTVEVHIHADATTIGIYNDMITSKFDEVLTEIEWMYSSDGASITIPLRADRHPVAEMYPFLGEESLEEYYDRFMDSSASILLLIGPPGTGKTSFIRGLMQHTQSSAIVTYDENILSKDYVFANFIEGDQNVMVIEDADMFLRARSDGNSTMHKFLNVGDGLVTTRNKKLIFSTNLPSTRDVDPALIRPGRCFDVITFDHLTQADAEVLAKRVGVELTEKREKWTIAEVFHKQTFEPVKNSPRNKVGFV